MAEPGRVPADAARGRASSGGAAPPRRRVQVDDARWAAYDAVAAVHRDDAYANLVLPGLLRERGLGGRDAAFATELAYGTLRLTGTLDAIIASAAGRDMARIDPPVRDALRLGAYQLLRMRVPAHAAAATTVDLVRALRASATGFANAVLRRIAEHDWAAWVDALTPPDADPVERLAFAHAHPAWIARAFAEALGERSDGDLAETARLLAVDNEPAPVHLCARPGLADRDDLVARTGGTPGRWSPYAVVLPGGSPGDLREIADGRAHVQDEGSQLVATALATATLDGDDLRWLDLCAGPGGKAGLLGALAAGRGARVTAVEVAPHRAALVEQATRGLPVDVVHADGREVTGPYDRILVDAPCTGLGALRRRPEARWRRTPSDLPQLTRLQRELLGAALKAVRPGGIVAYVTCSPHRVETAVSVGEAVRRSPSTVEHVDARPFLPEVPDVGGDVGLRPRSSQAAVLAPRGGPAVQLWPHRHGTDAMYLALLRRTA